MNPNLGILGKVKLNTVQHIRAPDVVPIGVNPNFGFPEKMRRGSGLSLRVRIVEFIYLLVAYVVADGWVESNASPKGSSDKVLPHQGVPRRVLLLHPSSYT